MIQIQNIEKSWNGQKVIDKLNLEIPNSQIYGLLGPNGAGKSTTLNLLLGFTCPDKGKLLINELNVTETPTEVRKQIGYIPENVSLYPYLSGLENLNYFCKLSGLKYNKTQLSLFLSECGLQEEFHQKRTENYSKGMRQKVGIAIAYAKKATTYLLDEPASGLDPVASNELGIILTNLASGGATILMASHDIFRVREICHKIGILKNGILIQETTPKEVTAEELEKIYLNYMQR